MTLILVVDDESSIVEMLSEVLEEEGYEVITANNGLEGLNLLQSARPAVVMSDVMMPVLDGWEGLMNLLGGEVSGLSGKPGHQRLLLPNHRGILFLYR